MVRDAWSTALVRKRAIRHGRCPMKSNNLAGIVKTVQLAFRLLHNLQFSFVLAIH